MLRHLSRRPTSATPSDVRPRHRLAALLTALALTTTALVFGAATGAAPVAASTAGDDLTSRLNAERTSRGVPALTPRADLVDVAQRWAETMAGQAVLKHNPDLTSQVPNWSTVGENVGYGPDAATVHAAFMGSEGHRANILDTDYTEVGIGAVVVDGRLWVAEVFRRPLSTSTSGGGTGGTTSTGTSAATQSAFPGRLSYGSTGTAVKRVQRRLQVAVSGFYGRATRSAVARYQRRHGWRASGVVGRRTWNSLF